MNAFRTSLQRVYVECLEAILRPIVELTLYCGLGHSEFSAAVRRVFIEVASKEYGVRGRPANVAKIAAKTGLPRKVIQRHRSTATESNWTPDEETSPLNSIIHYWRFDERFSSEYGHARDLDFEGEDSFTSLVKAYAGDIPATTLRQELLREEIATQTPDGVLRLSRNFSFPEQLDEDFLRNAAFSIGRHIETLVHNARLIDLATGTAEQHIQAGRFERFVWSRHLSYQEAKELQGWIRSEGSAFVQHAEEFITRLERRGKVEKGGPSVSGVGVYFFTQD